jgi:hypothetical protein
MSEFPPFEYVRFFSDAAGEPHLERLKVDFAFGDHPHSHDLTARFGIVRLSRASVGGPRFEQLLD